MSELREALDAAAASGDLSEALRMVNDSVPALPGALVEWIAILPPALGQPMSTPRNRTFILVDEPMQEIDNSPSRSLLIGWNYGPASISIFSAMTNDKVGDDVSPQSEFVLPGSHLGAILVKALD